MQATYETTLERSDLGAARPVTAGGKAQRVTGRVLSGIAIAFLSFDAVIKLVEIEAVRKGTVELGYPVEIAFTLGLVLLASVLIHLIPRTAVLGALLLTGYLGGAVATHVRVSHPLFSHTLFPVYVAVFIWAGLVLRDPRVRAAFGFGTRA
ncbi:MAG TPA: DoxX family protein [Polyangiales bacterium]|nr:DoxX family protein [Polyangiales bacterium]